MLNPENTPLGNSWLRHWPRPQNRIFMWVLGIEPKLPTDIIDILFYDFGVPIHNIKFLLSSEWGGF
jgi:hypothetical protein